MIRHLRRSPNPGSRGWCLTKGSENSPQVLRRADVTCLRCQQTKGYRNHSYYPKEETE